MYMLPPPFFQREEKKLAPFEEKEATASVYGVLWVTVSTATVFYFITLRLWCQEKIYPRMFSEGF